MKLRSVMVLFLILLFFYLLLFLYFFINEYFFEKVEIPSIPLEDSVFEAELERVLAGEKVSPAFPGVPVMVWWTQFSGDIGVQNCGKHSCYVTNHRDFMKHPNVRNVFFYGTSVTETDLPLPRRGLDWSLLHEESPKNNQLFSHKEMMSLFNHTSTFRMESDFPLLTQYLEDIAAITQTQIFVSVEDKNRYMKEEGLAPVVYVQSGCDAPSSRDIWVTEFMKYIKVDSYGTCLHNKDLPLHMVGSEQMENEGFYRLLSKYKFMLSLENAVCDDYVTEKFWRCLQLGVVPIYLGAPNIDKYLPTTKSAVVVQNFSSVKDVADYVIQLNSNDQKYREYLQHKSKNQIENQYLKQLVEERSWGVSSQQQMELGNSVKHFQCMVCNRVAKNIKFSSMGFSGVRYRADVSHYGCPIPVHPLTNKVDRNNWYVQEYFRTKYAAQIIKEISENGGVIDPVHFKQTILDMWTEAFKKHVQQQEQEEEEEAGRVKGR